MPRQLTSIAAALVVLLGSGHAFAQERGKAGLSMGYPAAVGLVWQLSDRVAIRPEFQVARTTSELSAPGIDLLSSSASSWSIGAGVSGLFYLQRWDELSTYLSPRFAYSRSTATSKTSVSTTRSTSESNVYNGSLSFGAQYALGRRFSAFGEVGFGLTDTRASSATGSSSDGRIWSTRTGAGVIFYF
jgi:opacity protein-like surface antigen